jgi:hypothetical protein
MTERNLGREAVIKRPPPLMPPMDEIAITPETGPLTVSVDEQGIAR